MRGKDEYWDGNGGGDGEEDEEDEDGDAGGVGDRDVLLLRAGGMLSDIPPLVRSLYKRNRVA